MMNGRLVSNYTPVAAGDRAEVVHGADIEVDHQGRLPYHVPTLMREDKDMVAQARARAKTTAP